MSKNDVTGDKIQTRGPTKEFDDGFDRIFGVLCRRCGKRYPADIVAHTCKPKTDDDAVRVKFE